MFLLALTLMCVYVCVYVCVCVCVFTSIQLVWWKPFCVSAHSRTCKPKNQKRTRETQQRCNFHIPCLQDSLFLHDNKLWICSTCMGPSTPTCGKMGWTMLATEQFFGCLWSYFAVCGPRNEWSFAPLSAVLSADSMYIYIYIYICIHTYIHSFGCGILKHFLFILKAHVYDSRFL